MTDFLLSEQDAAAAWDSLAESHAAEAAHRTYRYYRPLADAADDFVREAQDADRVFTGQAEFDAEMRGISRGHLMVVVGFAHSAKTQWTNRMLRHNQHRRILVWTPDEPATLVLSKLASMQSGLPARELERRVAQRDPQAIDTLRNTALHDFPNLIVIDRPLTPNVMRDGYDEACDVWGAEPDLMVVDYVDLVQAGDSPPARFDFLKAFNAERKGRMVAIHQTSRSAGADGRKMTIASGNYGGEQHATFMVGVRRRKSAILAEMEELKPRAAKGSEWAMERLEELRYDLDIHQYTVTVNLVKNKRPGGGLVDDIDLEIDLETGRLYDLYGDLPAQFLAAKEAERAAKREQTPAQPAHHGWSQDALYEGEF